MNELEQLARFTCFLRLSDVPESVVNAARYCVLDTIGSALGAAGYEELPALFREFSHWSNGVWGTCASAWGQGEKAGVFPAMLINGMMAHALEMDDVHTGSKSHPGAVIVPAAWTLADALGASGEAFLEAVIAGYEVMARIGMGMNVSSNRKRGWHTTGIIGTFGAAAAASRLLGLNREQTLSAFGMAGTQSSGLWAFLAEGSTCKKLHPARAAVNGFCSAILAKGGMSGPSQILDAEDGGLYRAVSDSFDMRKVSAGLGETWEILKIDKKPYPCCRTTHHAIDAALFLRDMDGFHLEEVSSILVETYEVGVLQCGFEKYPESPVEAKFSIPYTCAAALVRGKVTQAEFTGELIADPMVRRLAESTKVVSDPLFNDRYPARWGSRMHIFMKDGRELVRQIDDISGSIRRPLTARQETDKFTGLALGSISSERAGRLMQDILRIEKLPELPDLC